MEPLESEQEEEDADDGPRIVNRHPRSDRDPENRDEGRQPDKREGHAEKGTPPSLEKADGEHDRQRLDPLDAGRESGGEQNQNAHRGTSRLTKPRMASDYRHP